MKVTPEHVTLIREAIDATGLHTHKNRERYRERRIPRGLYVQDIDKRFRWDLLAAANSASVDRTAEHPSRLLIATLYDAGYNDAHIDTALRSIVAPL